MPFVREAEVVNAWDRRSLVRALLATLLAFVVTWLVTAASDEGQLTMAIRTGRILPLVPLCGAVGVALALGTARARSEVRTLETLGRPATRSSWAAVTGAALPSLFAAALIASSPTVDVSSFFPRATRSDTFVSQGAFFDSASLGVRVDAVGHVVWLDVPLGKVDERLPHGGRWAAASLTAIAGVALALVVARASVRQSFVEREATRRQRLRAGIAVTSTLVATVVLLQAAAADALAAGVAVLPSLGLLLVVATIAVAQRRALCAEAPARDPHR